MAHRSTLSLKDAELIAPRIDDYRAGPKGSYFQTCLWGQSRDQRNIEVKMRDTLKELIDGLAEDGVKFNDKYRDPRLGRPTYTIELPKLGTNMKFSDPFVVQQKIESGDVAANIVGKGSGNPRFNVPTLRQWFNEIDADGSGEISMPELVNFLRSNKDLEQVMLLADNKGNLERGLTQAGLERKRETVNTQRKNAAQRNKELKRMIKICTDMDVDGSGAMDWSEFIDFFRRTGYLLEYSSTVAYGSQNKAQVKKQDPEPSPQDRNPRGAVAYRASEPAPRVSPRGSL